MRKLIETSQDSLIQCDNPVCDFNVPYIPELTKEVAWFINRPCPDCGENLLTEQDFIQHEKLLSRIKWLNKWFSWITIFTPKRILDNPDTVSFHFHDGVKIKREN